MLEIYTEEFEKYIEELEARLEEYENPNNAISDDLDHNTWLENEAEALRQEIENLRARKQEIRDIFAEIEEYNRKIEDYTKRMENAPTEHLKDGYGKLIEDFKKYQKELLNKINGKVPANIMEAITERLETEKKEEKNNEENKSLEEQKEDEEVRAEKELTEREKAEKRLEELKNRKKEIEERLEELGVVVKKPKDEEVKIEKQPRPIKVTPEQKDNIDKNEKKARKSVYAIMDSIIRDEDGKPFDLTSFQTNRVEGSRISVTAAMKQQYAHHNKIYNFFGKAAIPLTAAVVKLKKCVDKAYNIFHPSKADIYDQIVKNIDALPDEEIEVLYKKLNGTTANSMRYGEAIMTVVMRKVKERMDEKTNMPLRLEITALQADLMNRYDKVHDLKEKLATIKDPSERNKIQAEIDELSKDAAKKIKYYQEIWDKLDENLNGKGAHGLDEMGKAIKSHQNRRGKLFGHNINLQEGAEFSAKAAEMDERLLEAIDSGDNLIALETFGDFELLKYDNTKAKDSWMGELEDGAFMWKPMPETLDYNPDPLARYIATTVAEAAIVSGVIGNIKNYLEAKAAQAKNAQNMEAQQAIEAANKKNAAANQHNAGVEHQIDQHGQRLEGHAGEYGKGVGSMAREDNGFRRSTDEYGQYFDPTISHKKYHELDDYSHTRVDELSGYMTKRMHTLNPLKTSDPARYVEEMSKMYHHVHSDSLKSLAEDVQHMKNYLATTTKYSYKGLFKSLDDILNNSKNFDNMINGMIDSVKTGQALQELDILAYEPVHAIVQQIPVDFQPIISPMIANVIQTAAQAKLADKALDETKALGQSVEDKMEEISRKRRGEYTDKEELEKMVAEGEVEEDSYEHQAAM